MKRTIRIENGINRALLYVPLFRTSFQFHSQNFITIFNPKNFRPSADDEHNDDYKAVGFAAQLAAMDAEDDAMVEMDDDEVNFDSPAADTGVVGPEQRFDNVTGARPPLPPGVGVDPKKTVCMQLVDVDHMIGECLTRVE